MQYNNIGGMRDMTDETKMILEAIQGLQKEISQINDRLAVIELKQDRHSNKLESLELDVKAGFFTMDKKIKRLQDSSETIEQILKMNNMIPQNG